MESTTILVVIALAYGAFLGYCLGRYQGYKNGADIAREIYRK
jgi:membrane protein DedA with SNARE-associated domain